MATAHKSSLGLVHLYLDLLASPLTKQLAGIVVGHDVHALERLLRFLGDGSQVKVDVGEGVWPICQGYGGKVIVT